MVSAVRPGRRQGLLNSAPILVANLFPPVAVLRFGWPPETLVVVYLLELLFSFPLAGAKALFARRLPRGDNGDSSLVEVSSGLTGKRGSVEVASRLPPVYLRDLPFAAAVVTGATWFVIITGVAFSNVFTIADALARPGVLFGVATLVVGQSVEAWRDYVRDGGYETASPHSVVETATRQAVFVAVLLLVVPGADGLDAVGSLVVLVSGKLLVEWSARRARHGGGGRITGWLSGPDATREPPDPVAVPDDPPDASVPTAGRAALYTGLFDVLGRVAPFAAVPFVFVWLTLLASLEDPSSFVALALGLGLLALYLGYLGAAIAAFYPGYGWLEYRRYGDRLVAYDTLVEEPQWSAAVDRLRDVRVVPDRLPDRLLGTRTVAVTTGWGDDEARRDVGPVADPDALVDAFELPVRTGDLGPLRRAPVVVVLGCLAGLVAAVVALAAGPWMSLPGLLTAAVVHGWFAVPSTAGALRVVRVRASPERRE